MLDRIRGRLESVSSHACVLRLDLAADSALYYDVMLPAFTAEQIEQQQLLGQVITLYVLDYVESQGQGAFLYPRLAGFLTTADREFFDLLTTCKGIGYRKGLRAFAIETTRMASAIAERDVATLQSLPEIGRRTAETIIATIHDKVGKYTVSLGNGQTPVRKAASGAGNGDPAAATPGRIMREALELLVQLGENRAQASLWIDRAAVAEPPTDLQQLIQRVYAIKSGG